MHVNLRKKNNAGFNGNYSQHKTIKRFENKIEKKTIQKRMNEIFYVAKRNQPTDVRFNLH